MDARDIHTEHEDVTTPSEGRIRATYARGQREEGIGHALWRQKWIVVLTVAAALAAGTVYLRGMPSGYTATGRVYVQRNGPRIMNESQTPPNSSNTFVYTQAEIIKATPTLARALENPAALQAVQAWATDDPVAALKARLVASVGRTDDIITVALDTPTAEGSARVVNAVIDAYVAAQSQQTRSTASEILKVLQTEKTKQDELLTKRLSALAEFRTANGLLAMDNGQGNVVLQRLTQLSDSLTVAQMASIQAKASYGAAEAVLGAPGALKQGSNAQTLAGLLLAQGHDIGPRDHSLEQAEHRLEALRKEFTSDHPAVKAAEAAVAEMRQMQQEDAGGTAEGYMAALSQQAKAAETRETAIRQVYDQQLKEALELNSSSAKYALFQADIKRTEHLCEELDSRIKELTMTGEVGALNVSVLEPARPESALPRPNWPKVLGLAGLIGLVTGIGLALARAALDGQIHSAESVRDTLDLPILGSVPHCAWGKDNLGALVDADPNSALSESFRKIRTALCYGAQGAGRVVLVTSPQAGEGKTMVAGNLAVALACAGLRVLLVDADLRCPSQHGRFGLANEKGLSTTLRGECDAAAAIRPATLVGLDILPAGPIPERPSELLCKFNQMLSPLVDRYDFVVIDSPPLGPVTDAAVVATSADRVVLVLRANASDHEHTTSAVEALRQVGARIAGIVFNGVRQTSGRYGYSRGQARRSRREAAQRAPEAVLSKADIADRKAAGGQGGQE